MDNSSKGTTEHNDRKAVECPQGSGNRTLEEIDILNEIL